MAHRKMVDCGNSLRIYCLYPLPVPYASQLYAHIFYFLTRDLSQRESLLNFLKKEGIGAVFHYIPLHSSEFGKKSIRFKFRNLPETDSVSDTIIRLPLWVGMNDAMQDYVLNKILEWVQRNIV